MLDECHHIYKLISIDNQRNNGSTHLVFLPRHLLPSRQNISQSTPAEYNHNDTRLTRNGNLRTPRRFLRWRACGRDVFHDDSKHPWNE